MSDVKQDEFVEVEIYLPEAFGKVIFASWQATNWKTRHIKEPDISFEEYRNAYICAAIEADVWMKSPKRISAGTDGSIHIEAM